MVDATTGYVTGERDPYLGVTLADRYRIVRKIGGGGMGAVYAAEHLLLGKLVAVKVLHAQYAYDDEVVGRFFREAKAAAMLSHPNILACHDVGKHADGSPFLVLDLLQGVSLATELVHVGRFELTRAVHLVLQICSALGVAHAQGIVHRDMKPDNVFLTREGDAGDVVKVLDFGISKFSTAGSATRTGSMLGTPQYMAPEQMGDSSRVDGRADVYSVGVILFEMLAGRPPFEADTIPGLIMKVVSQPPPELSVLRPDLPPAVCAIVHRAMAKLADERLPSIGALAEALVPFAPPRAHTPAFGVPSPVGRDPTPAHPFAAPHFPTPPAGEMAPTEAAWPLGAASASTPYPAPLRVAGDEPPTTTGRSRTLLFAAIGAGAIALVGGGLALFAWNASSGDAATSIASAAGAPALPPASATGGDRYVCRATLAELGDVLLAAGASLPTEARVVEAGEGACLASVPGTPSDVRSMLQRSFGHAGYLEPWPVFGVATVVRGTLSSWSALRRDAARDGTFVHSLPRGSHVLTLTGTTRTTGDTGLYAQRGYDYVLAGSGLAGFVPVRRVQPEFGCIPSREALRASAGPFVGATSEIVGTLVTSGAGSPGRVATLVQRADGPDRSRVTIHRLDAACLPTRIDTREVTGWVGDFQLVSATAMAGPLLFFVGSHPGSVEAPLGIENWTATVLGAPTVVFSRPVACGRVPSGQRRTDFETALTSGPRGVPGYWPLRLQASGSSGDYFVWNGATLVEVQ